MIFLKGQFQMMVDAEDQRRESGHNFEKFSNQRWERLWLMVQEGSGDADPGVF